MRYERTLSESKIAIARTIGLLALSALLSAGAAAEPSPEQIAELGKSLTPMGSPRAGNEDGTIPEWTGGITQPPTGYEEGKHLIDPFAPDPILFTITATDLEPHRSKLSAGQIALFEKYPETYRLNVYRTRRTASYPQRVYDATVANAKRAKLTADGNGVEDAVISSPFPFPENGLHAIWNHKLRFQGRNFKRSYAQVMPQRGGSFTPVKLTEEVDIRYAGDGVTVENV
jgi:hypothetical protein